MTDTELYCEIGGLPVEVRANALSAAGLFVVSTSPPDPESAVELYMRSFAGSTTIAGLVVQVVSCERAEREHSAPGFGVLFTDLTAAQRLWLANTLARPPIEAAATQLSNVSDVIATLEQALRTVCAASAETVLGIHAKATADEARKAFGQLAKRSHPHSYARYNSPRVTRLATELFIAYKRVLDGWLKTGMPQLKPAVAATSPHVSAALKLLAAQRFDEAEALLDELAEGQPSMTTLHVWKRVCQARRAVACGEQGAARELYREILALDATHREALDAVGSQETPPRVLQRSER